LRSLAEEALAVAEEVMITTMTMTMTEKIVIGSFYW